MAENESTDQVYSDDFVLKDSLKGEDIQAKIKSKEELTSESSPLNIRYFKTEKGGLNRLTNNVTLHSLNENGDWVPNQYAISMFYDSVDDYVEITEAEAQIIIAEAKKNNSNKGLAR